jgi:nicotinate-nucleotide pyrophosphorylase (carboxylating)
MYSIDDEALERAIHLNVQAALSEDLGAEDITSMLIHPDTQAQATLISRDAAVVCGQPWVNALFASLDPEVNIAWQVAEGDSVAPNDTIALFQGSARSLLSGERAALNFLQMLSGTATLTAHLSQLIATTQTRLLDTRKTIPGLRLAQKYAVSVGGGHNHRLGLYDGYLIKENHIAACGGIAPAILEARRLNPGKWVEVEVENDAELRLALAAQPDMIMLDNFNLDQTRAAVQLVAGQVPLESSGGITAETLLAWAQTGVDYISMGSLTKDVKAIDLSFRLAVRG